jgi:hypothetical protein
MNSKFLRAYVGLLCMMAIFMYGSRSYPAASEYCPIIHFREISHTFSPVFEGTELTHTFVVSNKGTAALNIKKVTHS